MQGKRGISQILIIIIVAVIALIIGMAFLNWQKSKQAPPPEESYYDKVAAACEGIDFGIKDACATEEIIQFSIQNIKGSPLASTLEIVGEGDKKQTQTLNDVSSYNLKKFEISYDALGIAPQKIRVVPKTVVDEQEIICEEKISETVLETCKMGLCSSGETRACTLPELTGECRSGRQTCVSNVWDECVAAPEKEKCNGIDDDCDGLKDYEDPDLFSLYYDLDTFEEPNPGNKDRWLPTTIGGNTTHIDATTAYSGKNSLLFLAPWGINFNQNENLETKSPFNQKREGYSTADYPYICMAYKIPKGTKVNMVIQLDKVATLKSITMTNCENPPRYTKVATWNVDLTGNPDPLITDDKWHFKCIDINDQLDKSALGRGGHRINSIMFYDTGCINSPTGKLWIDNFLITSQLCR